MEEMAPGFRFYPTEDELVSFYIHSQLQGNTTNISRIIPLLDIYQYEPSQLPNHCGELCQGDTEQWFFFVPRKEREVRGGRPSRTTECGYWKATGSPNYVYSSENKVIGVKKSMVFYKGKAPTGRKTEWKMNEYKAIKQDLSTSIPQLRHEVSLCRVYVGSGTVRAFDRRPTHRVQPETSSSGEVNAISINSSPDRNQPVLVDDDDEYNLEMISDLMEWEVENVVTH